MPKLLEYSEEEYGGFEKRRNRPSGPGADPQRKNPRHDDEGQRDPTRDKKRKKKELDLDKKRKIKRGYLEE